MNVPANHACTKGTVPVQAMSIPVPAQMVLMAYSAKMVCNNNVVLIVF